MIISKVVVLASIKSFHVEKPGKNREKKGILGKIGRKWETVFFGHYIFAAQSSYINQKPKFTTMLDKISKNNKIMAIVSIATLAIVAYVLVYKPWKAAKTAEE